MEAAKDNPQLKRFIFVGSQTAVGPSINGTPVDDGNSLPPDNYYGKSKMEAEKEVFKFKDVIPIQSFDCL